MLKLYHKNGKKDSLLCKREKYFSEILQSGIRSIDFPLHETDFRPQNGHKELDGPLDMAYNRGRISLSGQEARGNAYEI